MTHEEKIARLQALPDGAVVEMRVGRGGLWVKATIRHFPNRAGLYLRQVGFTATNRPHPRREAWLRSRFVEQCVRPLDEASDFARMQGNVFADWLDERGFAEAGAALREAFPLIEREP